MEINYEPQAMAKIANAIDVTKFIKNSADRLKNSSSSSMSNPWGIIASLLGGGDTSTTLASEVANNQINQYLNQAQNYKAPQFEFKYNSNNANTNGSNSINTGYQVSNYGWNG